MLRLLKVRGQSLAPRFCDGDYVLVSSLALRMGGPRCGDAVVFHHPRLGRLIKLVERLEGTRLYVVGLDPDSVDSRRFGAIPRKTLLGKVIWHVRKK